MPAPACAGSAWPSCAACAAAWRPAPGRVPRAGARRNGAARRSPRPRARGSARRARSARVCRRSAQARRSRAWRGCRAGVRAGVEPLSNAAATGSAPSRRWIVAKCCSASVSVGAINAAWRPCSTARSIAYSATTVLPLPTSPISSRCIGKTCARSSRISAIARTLIAGRRERQPAREPALAQRRRLVKHRRATLRAAPAAPAQEQQLCRAELLEGEPSPAGLEVLGAARKVHRRERARSLGEPVRDPRRRRERLQNVAQRRAGTLHERKDLRRGHALGSRVVRDRAALCGARERLRSGARRGSVV